MKISIDYNDNIDVYINKFQDNSINFDDRETLEDYFRNLFFKLKKYYKININGFYDIKIYNDKYYGAIIHIENDNLDYCDYFGNQIDMRISMEKDSRFLYKINDLFDIDKEILNKGNIIKYRNNLYYKINNEITNIELGKIIENSNIIYDEEVDTIIKSGKIIV